MSKPIAWSILCLILLLSLSFSPKPLLAHGVGTLQVTSEPAGPYLVSVWSYPPRLVVGTPSHITVSVADEAENFVLDAAVQVTAILPQSTENLSAPATTAQATNKLFYEAYIIFPQSGLYTLNIQINGPQGDGALTFPLEVQTEGQTNWFSLLFIAVGLLLSMFMFRLWEKQPNIPKPRR